MKIVKKLHILTFDPLWGHMTVGVTRWHNKIFGENELLTPVTPNDPG